MKSPEYIIGMLDVLEKSGEVSPAYADGVRDTLTKKAFWPLVIGGTAALAAGLYGTQKYSDGLQTKRFNDTLQRLNKERGGTDSDIRLTREDTEAALSAARPWHDNITGRTFEWARSKVRPLQTLLTDAWRSDPNKTWDDYVLDHENWQRADEQDYMRRANLEGNAGGPLGQWAMADLHAKHSDAYNDYATAAKHWMANASRESMGLPDTPVNMYQTPYTQQAINSGAYRLKYDYGRAPKTVPAGYGKVNKSFGDSSGLFRNTRNRIEPRRY